MISFKTEMWQDYSFHGLQVRVIQQWHDPFGRPMLRVEAIDPNDDRAEGMLEEIFMRDAALIPQDSNAPPPSTSPAGL